MLNGSSKSYVNYAGPIAECNSKHLSANKRDSAQTSRNF